MTQSRNALFACLAIGILGLAASLFGGLADAPRALHAYLTAYMFWLSLALGSLGWLLVFHAGRSRWIVLVRRPLEVNAATLPVFALLLLPIFLNLPHLYEWATNPRVGTGDPTLLDFRAAYLSVGFVWVRAAIYFAVWGGISSALYRWSILQDRRPGELVYTVRARFWSAAALPALGMTMGFAAIDWVMSLRPGWISTMFGFYVIAGAVVGSMALFAVQTAWLQGTGRLPAKLPVRSQHNIGKLLFAFTVFWAYIGFSQFLLIWMGNLKEELPWMLQRTTTGWQPVAYFLLLGHFCLPFALLLPVAFKVRPNVLAWIGAWVLVTHYVDVYWLVLPHLTPAAPQPSWLDPAAFLGVGGIAAATWLWLAARSAAAPLGDQYLHESMQPSHG